MAKQKIDTEFDQHLRATFPRSIYRAQLGRLVLVVHEDNKGFIYMDSFLDGKCTSSTFLDPEQRADLGRILLAGATELEAE